MKTMIRTTILSLTALTASFIVSSPANSQTTYIDNGSSNTYTLNANDSLYIASGTFTGTINTWNAGPKITVAQSAYFKPSSFNDNRAKVIVYGTAVFPSLKTNAGFDLKNYGTITVNGEAAINGGSQTWTNYFGAIITFKDKIAINYSGSSFVNNGTVTAKSDFFLYSNSVITNNNNFSVEGDFKTSQGQVNNSGKFYVLKNLTISGSTSFTNTCRTVAEGGITINSSTVYNSGLLWASNANNNSIITNNGTIINGAQAKVKSVTFTNNGTISGSGFYYFTGVTTGSGTIGISGTTTDTIKVYDATRSNPSTIFDNQWGTIRPNVVFAIFAAPDTSNSAFSSCSSTFASASSAIALPITWIYFHANNVDNVPVLDWAAEHDPGTYYEIERSYDNKHFQSIASINAEDNKTVYTYNDKNVDNSRQMVYYRIKGVEPTGEQKFTEIRVVKFTNKTTSPSQVSPNPFTSQFTVRYETRTKEQVTIKIYNGMGQLNMIKTITANTGLNQVTINEASQLARGIYIVEISNGGQVTFTQKIVKR